MEKPIQMIDKDMLEEISFGKWLRQRRRALDLTQKALAKQVGCAEITVRQMERNILKPSKELAEILLERLGIPEFERPGWIVFARGASGYPTKTKWHSHRVEPKTNLPIPLTSFIGLLNDVQRVQQRLRKHRLVTLTGVGGIGKTRLSQQVGRQVLENYADGVWFIELASLTDPALVPQTVATVFGLKSQSDLSFIEMLIQALRNRTMLLILDNCEHLLDACSQLADKLLQHCENLRILATSRESLGIVGEALYQVPSLTIPQIKRIEPAEKLNDYESVRLFDERAQLIQMDFELTAENVFSVARICSRLDGIPLAIELAAGRIQTLSAQQIAQQLDQCFHILKGTSRTALPKHQTLQACIDWSWNLLSDTEQVVLSKLSVFAGSFTQGAAEQVCAGEGIEPHQVMDLIYQLVRKSLIVEIRDSVNEQRYRLLETIRQYAREKLDGLGQAETSRTSHLKYFLQLSEQAEPALRGSSQTEWHLLLNKERDNLRAALEWAAKNDIEAGLSLSGKLHRFWEGFDVREGARWLAEFLQKTESKVYPIARAKALCSQSRLTYWIQDFDLAYTSAREALELSRACGDKIGEIDALFALGLSDFKAHVENTIELYKQALNLSKLLGDPWRQAYALAHLGGYGNKLSQLEDAALLFEKFGDLETASKSMQHLVMHNMLNGNLQSARKWLDRVVKMSQNLNNKSLEADILHNDGCLALIEGNYERARESLDSALEIAHNLGHRMTFLWTSVRLGYLSLREGKLDEAYDEFINTAQEFQKDKSETGVVFTLEGVASLKVKFNQPVPAARLIGWADTTRKATNDLRPPIEQADVDKVITACLTKLGEIAFSDAYDEGQKMTLDEAVAYALQEN